MAETGIKIEVDTTKIVGLLGAMKVQLNPVAMLKLIGMTYLNWINKNFREQGAERPWPGLSPNTMANPERGDRPILVGRARTLERSFNVRGVKIEGTNAVSVGSNIPYASFHHFGTKGPYTIVPVRAKALRFWTVEGLRFSKMVQHPGVPARPLLPSKELAEKMAIETMQAYVKAVMTKAGRSGVLT